MNARGVRLNSPDPKQRNARRGHLFIISAPSGAGKTTLTKAVLDRCNDILYSISYTTRKPRSGEQDGIDYNFISRNDFKKCIKDAKWAEWAEVHGNYYGTSAEFIDKSLVAGSDVLLDIDVQGAAQLLERYPESITIFIMPPSVDILKKRLELRATDNRPAIEKRLFNARNEIAQKGAYRHVVVNDRLPDAVDELMSIINKYRKL